MSEDVLLKDAEDEANQASAMGVDPDRAMSLYQDEENRNASVPPLTSADAPGLYQSSLPTQYPQEQRVQKLEDSAHRGSYWPKNRIQKFNELTPERQEELRGTNAEHYSDVSPLDFDPLHETHSGIKSDGTEFSVAPMWVRLLESFFIDGVSKKHKEKEYAWEKEYLLSDHITRPDGLGALPQNQSNHDLYEAHYYNFLKPQIERNPEILDKLNGPDGAEFEKVLRRIHMNEAIRSWQSDEIDEESGRRIGMGEEDYLYGMEWLTPAQRVQVYQHMAENDMDSLEHQTIPGLENYSIPRAKRNFLQRYSPIAQHWTGHPNYAANPVFARLLKDPPYKYDNVQFKNMFKQNAPDLFQRILDYNSERGNMKQPHEHGYFLPSGGRLRRRNTANSTPEDRFSKNDLLLAAGIDPDSTQRRGDSYRFYEQGEHPLYGELWNPNSVDWTPDEIKQYLLRFEEEMSKNRKDHNARNAVAFHSQPYVAHEGEGAHAEEYTMNEPESLSHHWSQAHMKTGGMGKAHETRKHIEHTTNLVEGERSTHFSSHQQGAHEMDIRPLMGPMYEDTVGDTLPGYSHVKLNSMRPGYSAPDLRGEFTRDSEHGPVNFVFPPDDSIHMGIGRGPVYWKGFGNRHITRDLNTFAGRQVNEAYTQYHSAMSAGDTDTAKRIKDKQFNTTKAPVHAPYNAFLGTGNNAIETSTSAYKEGQRALPHNKIAAMIGARLSSTHPQGVRAHDARKIPLDVPDAQFGAGPRIEFVRSLHRERRKQGAIPPSFSAPEFVFEKEELLQQYLSSLNNVKANPLIPEATVRNIEQGLQSLQTQKELARQRHDEIYGGESLVEGDLAGLKRYLEARQSGELPESSDETVQLPDEDEDEDGRLEQLHHNHDYISMELHQVNDDLQKLLRLNSPDAVQVEEIDRLKMEKHHHERDLLDIENELNVVTDDEIAPHLDSEGKEIPNPRYRHLDSEGKFQETVNSHIEAIEQAAMLVLQKCFEQGFDPFEMFKDEFGNPRPDTAVAWLMMQGNTFLNVAPHGSHKIGAMMPVVGQAKEENPGAGVSHENMLINMLQTSPYKLNPSGLTDAEWLRKLDLTEELEEDGKMVVYNNVDESIIKHAIEIKRQLMAKNKAEDKIGREFMVVPSEEIIRRMGGMSDEVYGQRFGDSLATYLKDEMSFRKTGDKIFDRHPMGNTKSADNVPLENLLLTGARQRRSRGKEAKPSHIKGTNIHPLHAQDKGWTDRFNRRRKIMQTLTQFLNLTKNRPAMEDNFLSHHPLHPSAHRLSPTYFETENKRRRKAGEPELQVPKRYKKPDQVTKHDHHILGLLSTLSGFVSRPVDEQHERKTHSMREDHALELQQIGPLGNHDTNAAMAIYNSPSLRYHEGSRNHTVPLGLHIDHATGEMTAYKKDKPEKMQLITPTLPSVLSLAPPEHHSAFGPAHKGAHTLDSMPHSMLPNSANRTIYSGQGTEHNKMDGPSLLASLTNPDVIRKDMPEGLPSLQPMHRIFELDDLEHLRGFTGDWIVSAFPEGERFFVGHKEGEIFSKATLSEEEKDAFKKVSDKQYIVDVIRGKDVLHIFDVIEYDDENAFEMPVQERIKILRGAMESHEMVHVPSASDTKLTDDDGLASAVKALDTDRILMRDAKSAYMKGEPRHPKWVMLQSGTEVVLMVLDRRGDGPYTYRLGTGPVAHGEDLGDRRVKYEGDDYMDVGAAFESEDKYNVGDLVKVDVTNVTETQASEQQKLFTVHASKIEGEAEGEPLVSSDSLGILAKAEPYQHGVEIFRKGSNVHIQMEQGSVLYKATQTQEGWAVHTPRSDNGYLIRLSESQRPFWSPIVGILLKANMEIEEKAEVHESEDEAEPLIEPKKVKGTDWKKKTVMVKGLEVAMRLLTKSGVGAVGASNSGTKGLGIDYATPIESPSGPTNITDNKTMPDYDVRDVERDKNEEAEDKKEVKENDSLSPNLELTEDKAVYHTS